jgi:hypothetical protein
MRFLNKVVALLVFLFAVGYADASNLKKEEVIFIREYREYGWKEYDANAVRLPRPIQTLIDFYLVEYRLNATHLTITKISKSQPSIRTLIFTTSLSRTQQRAMQKIFSNINPNLIQHKCNSNTTIVDDGFHLDVTLTKSNETKSFIWNGNYVDELILFVDVINRISPEKYRFYELDKQDIFKQSLTRY